MRVKDLWPLMLWIAFTVVVIGGLIVTITIQLFFYRVDNEAALARFRALTTTENVVIVRNTNTAILIGDPFDVTYELLVNGRPLSGRCTTARFSEMVCRVYVSGTD